MDTVILPICADEAECGTIQPGNASYSLRLYYGATLDNPYEGMFSYFPTLPLDQCPDGFARPVLSEKRIITNTLPEGPKSNLQELIGDVQELWFEAAQQVLVNNLKLGIWTSFPICLKIKYSITTVEPLTTFLVSNSVQFSCLNHLY